MMGCLGNLDILETYLHTKYKYNVHMLEADNSYDCVGTRLHTHSFRGIGRTFEVVWL